MSRTTPFSAISDEWLDRTAIADSSPNGLGIISAFPDSQTREENCARTQDVQLTCHERRTSLAVHQKNSRGTAIGASSVTTPVVDASPSDTAEALAAFTRTHLWKPLSALDYYRETSAQLVPVAFTTTASHCPCAGCFGI